MCGIAGIAGLKDTQSGERAIAPMLCAMARRGPDDLGVEFWPGTVLGHRRLSIFDVSSAGHQPMLSDDRSVGVVFNGAIYNFRDLRTELTQAGYGFRSNTDTEVLVHGYHAWGMDGLVTRLHGMFAIGLWDAGAGTLYLVRDRLGVKPLFYSCRGPTIAFASSAAALRAANIADAIDDTAIAEFLEFGYVTDARSIYQGVQKVAAGTIVEWSHGSLREREYWRPPSAAPDGSVKFDDAVEETERLFLRAVELRLDADVPVGALLSGGIDSSLVCWAVARLGGDVKAFTVGTPGHEWDEAADATLTASTLAIEHEVVTVAAGNAPDVHELTSAFGEPFACASALGMLRVSQAVKPKATVLLTGDGGDDVFLGYPEHVHLWMAQQAAERIPRAAARSWPVMRRALPQVGVLRRASNFLSYATGGLGAVIRAGDGLPFYARHRLLGERLEHVGLAQRAMPPSLDSARCLLADFLVYDRKTRFVGEYLTKVDGATMHYALEARAPFLDQDLWSFASRLPFDVRLRGWTLKAVLRELARRHLGERVAGGSKRGFGVPVQRWLATDWHPALVAAMADSELVDRGFIRRDALETEIRRVAAVGHAPKQLWYLFVLETWFKGQQAAQADGTRAAAMR